MLKFGQFLLCTVLVLILVLTGTGILASFEVVPEDESAQFLLIDDDHTQVLPVDALDIPEHDSFESASRLRTVTVSDWVGKSGSVAVGDEVVLNMFSDASYAATIDRVSTNVNDTLCVRGRLQDYPWGYVIITFCDQEGTYASIEVPEEGRQYILFEGEGELYYVAELDPDKTEVRPEAPPLVPEPPSRNGRAEIAALREHMVTSTLGPNDPATIGVMIVYTPAAEDWAGAWYAPWRGGMNNQVAQAMEKAQLALDNSDTGVTLELVLSARVDYTEHGSSSVDLGRLRDTNDGYMDEVHYWRDIYGADLVQLFCVVNDVAGRAYLLTSESGQPAYAFSLTDIRYANSYTTIHEMGHNMGCHHHKQDSSPGPGLFDYSAGWRFSYLLLPHCTVMAYTDDYRIRVPYFSNPDITFYGIPTGHPDDGDNASTIREVKHVVAAYKEVVIEDFEWGSDGTSLGVEPPLGDVDWTVTVWIDWLGTASAEIDSWQHHSGTRSAEFYIDYGNSVFASYPDYHPSYRGFWLRTDGNVRPTTRTGDGQHSIGVKVNGTRLQYYYNGWHNTNCLLIINRWYLIEFKDIDWENAEYSIYVGDNYVDRVPMSSYTGCNGITEYSSCEYAGSFWIDDVVIVMP
jgi:hypothetical protein